MPPSGSTHSSRVYTAHFGNPWSRHFFACGFVGSNNFTGIFRASVVDVSVCSSVPFCLCCCANLTFSKTFYIISNNNLFNIIQHTMQTHCLDLFSENQHVYPSGHFKESREPVFETLLQKCTATIVRVTSHGQNQLAIFFFFDFSLLVSCFSPTSPPFPGSAFICDPVLFSVGVSGLRQFLYLLVSYNCTLEKKTVYAEGAEPSYWNAKTNGQLGQTQACGIHFCCPSLLGLCCQWLFGLLKWPIFSLLRQSPLVIFQSLSRLWHGLQVLIKNVCRLVNF